MQKKYKNNNIKIKNVFGFSIVELVVAISIMVLITSVFLTNYHDANNKSKLTLATQKLVSDIRLSQNYSLGLKEFNGNFSLGGWGIYLATTSPSYIIFADENGNFSYNEGEKYQTILFNDIVISNIAIDTAESEDANIVFEPPNPNTKIESSGNSIKITLKNENENSTKTIEVNSLGLIDIID